MIVRFWNWLIDPEKPHCEQCEFYKTMLDLEKSQNAKLLEHVISITSEKQAVASTPEVNLEQLKSTTKSVPWRIRREMLEAQDRKDAQVRVEKTKEMFEAKRGTDSSVSELEEELGIG